MLVTVDSILWPGLPHILHRDVGVFTNSPYHTWTINLW